MSANKKYRLLMGYCPYYGYGLSKKLIEENVIEYSLVSCYKTAYAHSAQNIEYIDEEVVRYARYEKLVDFNNIPALDKELMEKMLTYESMCIKLGMRRTNYPIIEYEEEKIKYHKHLRFWNHIISAKKINAVYFDEIPHCTPAEYVIYALATIKKIPIFIVGFSNIPGIRVCGSNLFSLGENINSYYRSMKDNNENAYCLKGKVKKFYETKTVELNGQGLKKRGDKNAILIGYFGKFEDKKTVYRYSRILLRYLKKKIKNEDAFIEKNFLDDYRRIRRFQKDSKITLKEYDKFAGVPDYEKKYIYFPLQFIPESSTFPQAGVFTEQYTAIQLIARVAKQFDALVYVKEHYNQPFRPSNFYGQLKEIDNLVFIKSSADAAELMRHSIVIATLTGTSILESALLNKPCIVVSSGRFWKGIPNTFEVADEQQGKDVLKKILNGYKIDSQEIKKYFYAIQETCIESYEPRRWRNEYGDNFQHSIENRCEKIKDYFYQLNFQDGGE